MELNKFAGNCAFTPGRPEEKEKCLKVGQNTEFQTTMLVLHVA